MKEWTELTGVEHTETNFEVDSESRLDVDRFFNIHLLRHPERLFDNDVLSELAQYSQEQRLGLLSKVCTYLHITPDLVTEYFYTYPDDLRAIKDEFVSSHGQSDSGLQNSLFSVVVLELEKYFIDEVKDIYEFKRYKNIAVRKNRVPEFALGDFDFGKNFVERFEGHDGDSVEKFKAILELAGEVSRGEIVAEHPHFFEALQTTLETVAPEKRVRFLRTAIAETHHHILFNEVYQSEFTPEGIESVRQAYFDTESSIDALFAKHGAVFNVAHSILFKSPHNISVYGASSQELESQLTMQAQDTYVYYQLMNALLDHLSDEVTSDAKEENTEFLVDLWNKNRNPLIGARVAGLLSQQSPDLAVHSLLSLVRDEHIDKKPLTAMLFRLEVGEIPITEKGVMYLEQQYDLGEYNDPSYHARRISVDGEVGVFNAVGELLKWFTSQDPENITDQSVKAKIHDIAYEILFYSNPNETTEQRIEREELLEQYKKHFEEIAGDRIFDETGVSLANLTIPEQGQFIIYFNRADEEKKDRLREFVARHKEEGIKLFLAMQAGDEYGERILALDEEYEYPEAQAVIYKCSEILSLIDRVDDYIKSHFLGNLKNREELIPRMQWNMLKRAGMLIDRYVEEVKQGKKKNYRELVAELESTREGVVLFAEGIRTLIESGEEIDFNDFLNTQFIFISASELREDQAAVEGMIEKYRAGFSHYPEEFQNERVREFQDALSRNTTRFALLTRIGDREADKTEVVGFIRSDLLEAGSDGYPVRHLAAFHVDADYRKLGIGFEVMKKVFNHEAMNARLLGECNPRHHMTPRYINDGGFIATGNIELNGVESFEIERDDRVTYYSKELSHADVVAMGNKQKDAPEHIIVEKYDSGSALNFQRIDRGYALAQIVAHDDDTYLVFEKKKSIKCFL